jgi:hypothetical protein
MSQGNGFGNGNGSGNGNGTHGSVVTLNARWKNSSNGKGGATPEPGTSDKTLVDFSEVRTQKLEEKRRKTERIFFKNLLGVYSVTGETRMRQIDLVDVSEEGCAFQVPFSSENPWPTQGNDLPIRLYFSQDTYLEVRVKVVNSRPYIENGERYIRYGCVVDQTLSSYTCYQQFVRFMHSYSDCAHRDLGDVSVFYL